MYNISGRYNMNYVFKKMVFHIPKICIPTNNSEKKNKHNITQIIIICTLNIDYNNQYHKLQTPS